MKTLYIATTCLFILSCSKTTPEKMDLSKFDKESLKELTRQVDDYSKWYSKYAKNMLARFDHLNNVVTYWNANIRDISEAKYIPSFRYHKFEHPIVYLRDLNVVKTKILMAKHKVAWFHAINDISTPEKVFDKEVDEELDALYREVVEKSAFLDRDPSLVDLANRKLNEILAEEESMFEWMINNKDYVEGLEESQKVEYWRFTPTFNRFSTRLEEEKIEINDLLKNEDFYSVKRAQEKIDSLEVSYIFNETLLAYEVTTEAKRKQHFQLRNELYAFTKASRLQLMANLEKLDNRDNKYYYELLDEIKRWLKLMEDIEQL